MEWIESIYDIFGLDGTDHIKCPAQNESWFIKNSNNGVLCYRIMKITFWAWLNDIIKQEPFLYRHLLTDTGITTTTIEEATANATSKIIIFAIPKGM